MMEDKLLFYSQKHIKGISAAKESTNWKNGVLSLKDLSVSETQQLNLFEESPITDSIQALINNNVSYFKKLLDKHDYYRLAYSYPEKVIFLDIETTGLSKVYSYITVIGWYKNNTYKHTLFGNSISDLIKDLNDSEIIVTFNGSLFDLPFLKAHYPELIDTIDRLGHIDLRFLLKRYGYTGGQKEIEKNLNYKRPKSLVEVDGREAISLWYKFLKGDNQSLKKILHYNCYDILGMIYILNYVFFNEIYGVEFPKVGSPKAFNRNFKKQFLNFTIDEVECSQKYVCEKITFFKHSFLKESYNHKIIGIDLTGSEKKASGCAYIKGNVVQTDLIYSDNDLIDYILRHEVDLVSIDSPLSLPYGRTSVFDDDPMRTEIGIMRYCERVLKKRGVNVYPSLIPSMQKLTKRGIELAQKIRKLGIPVIESFPGAAQDVLQIPRKRTDLFFLKQGLLDFGLEGEFVDKNISHDELDAITSALVGQFFISDYYEPLGNIEEDYLIIPSIKKNNRKNKIIIGVCGPIATGKTELSRYIENKGYYYTRYSKVIADYLEENGIEISRDNLQKFGLEIYEDLGQYWLNKRVLLDIADSDYVIIDGLRHPEDITFMKEHYFNNFISIFIDSKYIVREDRYKRISNQEYQSISNHEVEQNIDKLKLIADYCISNNGTIEELFLSFNNLIEKMEEKK